jgi:hypothetical protein
VALQRWEEAAQQLVNAARDRQLASERWDAAVANARVANLPAQMAAQKAANAGIDPEVILEILEALKEGP